jgi:transcriptional regulator with XRE-family HTH domain
MRRQRLRIGEEIRRLRLEAGLSLTSLAAVVGVHRSHVARIEAGTAHASVVVLTSIGVALGADLGLRLFPGTGPRLMDRFQAAMIEGLLGALHPRWTARLEVAITRPARGVIDVGLLDALTPVAIAAEAQSELRRLEQQVRWSSEKAGGFEELLRRESGGRPVRSVSRLLVLRSTTATRDVARTFRRTLSSAYPARCRDVHAALTTSGAPWPGAGIVWMAIDGSGVRLHPLPPRGVDLGR